MKVSRLAFTSAIAMATKVTVSNATLPIFESVLIAHGAMPPTLTVSATDLETRLHLEIPYEGGHPLPGAACVNAKALLKLLKTFDGPDLEIELKATGTEGEIPALVVDGIQVSGTTLPEDFPAFVAQPEPVVVPGLYGAIEFCMPFSSTDASRFALNSVYVNSEKKAKTTVVAATDGHRLATAWLPRADITALIPSAVLKALFSAPFRKSLQPDMVGWTDKDISFPLKNGYLTSRLLEGSFPSVERVIPRPEQTQYMIEADRTGLIATLTRAIAMSSDARRPPITLVGGPDHCLVLAGAAGAETELPAPGHVAMTPQSLAANGKFGKFAIGVNAAYLKGALEVMTGTSVAINIQDDKSPIWLTEGKMPTSKAPATWQSGKRTIVIMPMRTSYTMRLEEEKKALATAGSTEAVAEAS